MASTSEYNCNLSDVKTRLSSPADLDRPVSLFNKYHTNIHLSDPGKDIYQISIIPARIIGLLAVLQGEGGPHQAILLLDPRKPPTPVTDVSCEMPIMNLTAQ